MVCRSRRHKALALKGDRDGAVFFPKFGSLLASPAYAQEEIPRAVAKEDFRQNLAIALLFAISIFSLVCLVVYFSSKDEKKIAFSANMIQTVLGFYIGVLTGLMGLPSSTANPSSTTNVRRTQKHFGSRKVVRLPAI